MDRLTPLQAVGAFAALLAMVFGAHVLDGSKARQRIARLMGRMKGSNES